MAATTTVNDFEGCTTEPEIKTRFKELAKKLHPDHNPSPTAHEDFIEMNEQYQRALKGQDGQTFKNDAGNEYTYQYREALERDLADIIDKLLALKMEDVDVWIVGRWVWAKGNTRPHKDAIKAIEAEDVKPSWNSNREAWTWHLPQDWSRRSNKSFSEIAAQYGAVKLGKDDEQKGGGSRNSGSRKRFSGGKPKLKNRA